VLVLGCADAPPKQEQSPAANMLREIAGSYTLVGESFERDRHGNPVQDSIHTPLSGSAHLTINPDGSYTLSTIDLNGSEQSQVGVVRLNGGTVMLSTSNPDELVSVEHAAGESLVLTIERLNRAKLKWIFRRVPP